MDANPGVSGGVLRASLMATEEDRSYAFLSTDRAAFVRKAEFWAAARVTPREQTIAAATKRRRCMSGHSHITSAAPSDLGERKGKE